MDKLIEDVVFMEHFNPEREPGISGSLPCPFCGSRILSKKDNNWVCFRCGKTFKQRENNNE